MQPHSLGFRDSLNLCSDKWWGGRALSSLWSLCIHRIIQETAVSHSCLGGILIPIVCLNKRNVVYLIRGASQKFSDCGNVTILACRKGLSLSKYCPSEFIQRYQRLSYCWKCLRNSCSLMLSRTSCGSTWIFTLFSNLLFL